MNIYIAKLHNFPLTWIVRAEDEQQALKEGRKAIERDMEQESITEGGFIEVSPATYNQLKEHQQKEVNAFPMFFAFTKQSFDEGMKRLGLEPADTSSIVSIGSGGYIRKVDKDSFLTMFARHKEEREFAIKADRTGDGYIFQMFYYELNNHEFGYTGEPEETLDALGITREELDNDQTLYHGYSKAIAKILGYKEEETE